MEGAYELIRNQNGLPIKAFIHSIDGLNMHWHHNIEILLVLKGSVNIRIGKDSSLFKENDLIVINSNSIHNVSKTTEDNILLALQIDPDYYSKYYPGFTNIRFHCKSNERNLGDEEKFDFIRHRLARIVWEMNKKKEGFQLLVGSEVHLLLAYLLNNFRDPCIEDENIENIHKDMERIQSIISYINKNVANKVTLQEIADREHLNVYYLSHFIKKSLGISFQEYVNAIRLDRSIKLLVNTDKTIIDIAYESGFPSTKSLNRLFKREYDCSPTEYRSEYCDVDNMVACELDEEKRKSKSYLDVDRNAAFLKLFTYLKKGDNLEKQDDLKSKTDKSIIIDGKKEGKEYKPYINKLTTFGRAAEGLRQDFQDQLKVVGKDIGFEYVRFHGIFSDDMMVVDLDREGNIIYNWSYIDKLFDSLLKENMKPFVELGFMPSELKATDETRFWWKANISQPKDINLWTDLVKNFLKHCINRYGRSEVENWYFEVWNQPDLEYVYWAGTKEDYFEFYKATVEGIKSISKNLKVGGPAISYKGVEGDDWLDDFLIYCKDEEVQLDFVSLHLYPEVFLTKGQMKELGDMLKEGKDMVEIAAEMKEIYSHKDYFYDALKIANEKIEEILPYKPELHITEWNASAYDGNPIHDTAFVSTFIIRNVLKSMGLVDSLGYWTFTDIMEETKARQSHFHGGFGLMNKDGIKKPSFLAYELLSKLGNKLIGKEDDYIVTKSGEDIQILAYNFAYFDELFLRGDISALSHKERYLIYEEKAKKVLKLNIKNLSGHYKVTKYKLNRENGSSFDEWIKMGAPENMVEEEINYLKGKARPKMTVEYLDIEGDQEETLYIPVHGAELVTIEKRYKDS